MLAMRVDGQVAQRALSSTASCAGLGAAAPWLSRDAAGWVVGVLAAWHERQRQ